MVEKEHYSNNMSFGAIAAITNRMEDFEDKVLDAAEDVEDIVALIKPRSNEQKLYDEYSEVQNILEIVKQIREKRLKASEEYPQVQKLKKELLFCESGFGISKESDNDSEANKGKSLGLSK